jgi:hypothetical protein
MINLQLSTETEDIQFCEWWGSMAEAYYSSLYTGIDANPITPGITFKAYPNPANKILNIDIHLTETLQTTIHLFDLSGKMISSAVVSSENKGSISTVISTVDLNPGAYLLQLISGNHSSVQKISIIH